MCGRMIVHNGWICEDRPSCFEIRERKLLGTLKTGDIDDLPFAMLHDDLADALRAWQLSQRGETDENQNFGGRPSKSLFERLLIPGYD